MGDKKNDERVEDIVNWYENKRGCEYNRISIYT